MAFQNEAAKKRRKFARQLQTWMQQLGLLENLREVSKATGVDMETLKALRTGTPKLETLNRIATYVEAVAKEQAL